jgi:hypothetical protein
MAMSVLKLKGEIDESGKLILPEFVDMAPGKVDVIVVSVAESDVVAEGTVKLASQPIENSPKDQSFESFMDWLAEGLEKLPADFDADEAKWQYLKEKHNMCVKF